MQTLPWSWYTDPDVLRREQERIFQSAWQYVGHGGMVAEHGDQFAGRSATCRFSSCGTARICAPSSTSAVIVAPSSSTGRGTASRSSARTTRGRTGWMEACAPHRVPTVRPASRRRACRSSSSASNTGGPSSSSIPTPRHHRSWTHSGPCRGWSRSTASSSMFATTTSSARTGDRL